MSETPIIDLPAAKESAYESGFNRFESGRAETSEMVHQAIDNFQQSAEYANLTLPRLRALSGYGDSDRRTFQKERQVAVAPFGVDGDLPCKGELMRSHQVLEIVQQAWEMGVVDALEGKDRYDSFEP